MKKMKIIHISCIDNERVGGVGFVVPEYVEYQSKYAFTMLYDINNVYLQNKKITRYIYNDYDTISKLPSPYNQPDLVVFHEVYKKEYIKLYKECINRGIPYIIVPHGCITKNAQKIKYIKKKIGNILLFKKFIKMATMIHYLSPLEQETSIYNKAGFICGNGIHIVEIVKQVNINEFTFLFIGRYNIFHKGLDILLDSVEKISNWFRENNIKILMYGMGRNKNINRLRKIIYDKNIGDIVILNGAVYGKEKEQVLKNSSVFILTSRYEGLPQGIQEALVRGIPCLVSPGTGFDQYINKNKCGYCTNGTVESTCKMIKKAYNERNKFNELSKNGHEAILRDYRWDKIAKKNLEIYEKILIDN